MFNHRHIWLITFTLLFGIICLWKTSVTWTTPSALTSTSIQLDLSLSSIIQPRVFNISVRSQKASKKRHKGAVSRYMLQLYHKRPSADIVRALSPLHTSGPVELNGGGRVIEFELPPVNPEEYLEEAELLGTAGMIFRVKSIDNVVLPEEVRAKRRDESWQAFDVTSAVRKRKSQTLKFLIKGRVRGPPEGPILLLSYSKPKKRRIRSTQEDSEEPPTAPWLDARRRRKNPCRKRPLYVDFSTINYDDWIVAPPGYDAYQCMGKCFFPFPDHLSPTKHAIVQALVQSALQGNEGAGKNVGKVCCVPTRLAPTSLLYLDASGTLTYQYGYEDMVVVECGCR